MVEREVREGAKGGTADGEREEASASGMAEAEGGDIRGGDKTGLAGSQMVSGLKRNGETKMDKLIRIGTQKYVERNGVKIPVMETSGKKRDFSSGSLGGSAGSGYVRAFGGISKPKVCNAPPADRVAKKKIEQKAEKKAEENIRKEEIPAKMELDIRKIEEKIEKGEVNPLLARAFGGNVPTEEVKTGEEAAEKAEKEIPEMVGVLEKIAEAKNQTEAIETKPVRKRRGRKRKQAAEDGMLI